MPSDFNSAIKVILDHEGGYCNNPNDYGGPTNYGISLRWLKTIIPQCDESDIRNLSMAQAMALYRRYFWQAHNLEAINDQQVATKIFDMVVNMGDHRAGTLVQKALNDCGKQVDVDGIIGPKTIEAINMCNNLQLLGKVIGEQSDFYRELAARDPSQKVFLTGWLQRAAWPFGGKK